MVTSHYYITCLSFLNIYIILFVLYLVFLHNNNWIILSETMAFITSSILRSQMHIFQDRFPSKDQTLTRNFYLAIAQTAQSPHDSNRNHSIFFFPLLTSYFSIRFKSGCKYHSSKESYKPEPLHNPQKQFITSVLFISIFILYFLLLTYSLSVTVPLNFPLIIIIRIIF